MADFEAPSLDRLSGRDSVPDSLSLELDERMAVDLTLEREVIVFSDE